MSLRKTGFGALALAMGALVAIGSAPAQDAPSQITDSHLQAARAAIAAIDATDRFDAILPDLALQIKAQLIQANPDLENEIIEIVDEATIGLAGRRADLENAAAAVYARAFSEEDLRAIADFYATEAGQALIASGPIIAREVQNTAGVWRRGVERDLRAAVRLRLAQSGLRTAPEAPQAPAEPAEAPAE